MNLILTLGVVVVALLGFRNLNHHIHSLKRTIMTQLDDLNSAIEDLATTQSQQFDAVIAEIKQLSDAIAAGNTVDLSGPIARLQAMKQSTADSLAALQADDPAAP